MSSRDLAVKVKVQKQFINELLDRLEGQSERQAYETPISINVNDVTYAIDFVEELLNDSYFKGLEIEQILELARKSIRLTDDNCKLRHKLEDIGEILSAYSENDYVQKCLKIIKRGEEC